MAAKKRDRKQAATPSPPPTTPALAIESRITRLDEIRQHPLNPRMGNIEEIERSIRRNGFFGVVVVQRSTGYALVGNHRRLAAERAGLTEIPAQWVDVDDETAKRILLADNRTSDIARYDERKLGELLKEMARPALEGTGYDPAKVKQILERTVTFNTGPRLGGVTYSVVVEGLDEAGQINLLRELEARGLRVRAIMA